MLKDFNGDLYQFKHPKVTVFISPKKKFINISHEGQLIPLESITELKEKLTSIVDEQYASDVFKEVITKL